MMLWSYGVRMSNRPHASKQPLRLAFPEKLFRRRHWLYRPITLSFSRSFNIFVRGRRRVVPRIHYVIYIFYPSLLGLTKYLVVKFYDVVPSCIMVSTYPTTQYLHVLYSIYKISEHVAYWINKWKKKCSTVYNECTLYNTLAVRRVFVWNSSVIYIVYCRIRRSLNVANKIWTIKIFTNTTLRLVVTESLDHH